MEKRFQVGDTVVHIREGISKIVSSTNMCGMDYFVVSVCKDKGEEIFVPIARADSVIRFLLSKEDAIELLNYIKSIEPEYNPNTKQRRDNYKKRLGSGDVRDVAFLARQLYFYDKMKSDNEAMKLGQLDIDMLEHANRFLLDELALVYSVPREEASDYINNLIETL